jgi:hypothetical protein
MVLEPATGAGTFLLNHVAGSTLAWEQRFASLQCGLLVDIRARVFGVPCELTRVGVLAPLLWRLMAVNGLLAVLGMVLP